MIALVAVLKIKPGTEKEVAAACRTMAAAVNREERDCLLYDPYVPVDGNPEVHFIEQYSNIFDLSSIR